MGFMAESRWDSRRDASPPRIPAPPSSANQRLGPRRDPCPFPPSTRGVAPAQPRANVSHPLRGAVKARRACLPPHRLQPPQGTPTGVLPQSPGLRRRRRYPGYDPTTHPTPKGVVPKVRTGASTRFQAILIPGDRFGTATNRGPGKNRAERLSRGEKRIRALRVRSSVR